MIISDSESILLEVYDLKMTSNQTLSRASNHLHKHKLDDELRSPFQLDTHSTGIISGNNSLLWMLLCKRVQHDDNTYQVYEYEPQT